MSDNPDGWKLDELAALAEVSARTVRYYVQRGLLPAPDFRGRDTLYTDEHLLRLKAIRVLQASFLPLDRIQTELGQRTRAELEALVQQGPQEKPESYVVSAGSKPSRTLNTAEGLGRRWQSWEVLPGLTVALADDAGPRARALWQTLQQVLAQASKSGD